MLNHVQGEVRLSASICRLPQWPSLNTDYSELFRCCLTCLASIIFRQAALTSYRSFLILGRVRLNYFFEGFLDFTSQSRFRKRPQLTESKQLKSKYDKTEFMPIGSRQRLSNLTDFPTIDNVQISQVATTKSLGVTIDNKLN